MSRAIKFRLWAGGKMHYGRKACAVPEFTESWGWTKRDKYVLQQFTGLLDKNGREIYEGDIVKWDGPHDAEWVGTIEYAALSFEINWFKTPYPVANTRLDSRVRVVGNKFENPELL